MEASVGEGARSPVWGDEIAGGFLGQGRSSVSLVFLGKMGSHWSISNRNEMIRLTFEKSPCGAMLGKGRWRLSGHTWGSKKWLISDAFWKLTRQDWVTDGVWDVRKQFEYNSEGFGPSNRWSSHLLRRERLWGKEQIEGRNQAFGLGINVRCSSHSPLSVLRRQDLDKGMWLEMQLWEEKRNPQTLIRFAYFLK